MPALTLAETLHNELAKLGQSIFDWPQISRALTKAEAVVAAQSPVAAEALTQESENEDPKPKPAQQTRGGRHTSSNKD